LTFTEGLTLKITFTRKYLQTAVNLPQERFTKSCTSIPESEIDGLSEKKMNFQEVKEMLEGLVLTNPGLQTRVEFF